MGYIIQYGSDTAHRSKWVGSFLRVQLMTVAFLVLFVLCVGKVWPKGRDVLHEFLFSGGEHETQTAFQSLTDSVISGEPIGEAVEAFCREIIENANLPE